MTYGVFTIQAFTEAFLANLQARVNAAEGANVVPVFDGPPDVASWDRPDWIMLGDVAGDGTIEVFDRTTQPRDESYTLNVVVTCARQSRTDQKTVNDRAWVLADYVNQELRGNPRQGVATVKWSVVFVHGQAKRASSKTRECTLELGVVVHTRI